MRSVVTVAALIMAVATSAATGEAAVLNFTGKMIAGTDSPPFLANGNFNMSVTYNENTGGPSGNASATTFSAQKNGGGTIDYTKTALVPFTLDFAKSGTDDTLTLAGVYSVSTGGQPALGILSLVFTRAGTSGPALTLTSANVAKMLSAYSTYSGTFVQSTNGNDTVATAVLGGTIPVPEPGSIGLLAGLGMVCGRRIWRRRQQKKAAAV